MHVTGGDASQTIWELTLQSRTAYAQILCPCYGSVVGLATVACDIKTRRKWRLSVRSGGRKRPTTRGRGPTKCPATGTRSSLNVNVERPDRQPEPADGAEVVVEGRRTAKAQLRRGQAKEQLAKLEIREEVG